jgi:hypothetical protein
MLLNVALFVLSAAWLQQRPELPAVLWVYAPVAALGDGAWCRLRPTWASCFCGGPG